MITAIDHNNLAEVRNLLRQGADPNAPAEFDDERPIWQRLWDRMRRRSAPQGMRETALLRAVNPSLPKVDDALTHQQEADKMNDFISSQLTEDPVRSDIVRALVEAGANVNVQNAMGETPLIIAAHFGRLKAMRVLVSHGAEVTVDKSDNEPPLMVAAGNADAGLVKALLDRGASVNIKTDTGETVLMAAVAQFRAGVATQVRETVACLIQHGASVQGKDMSGETVLLLAHQNGNDPQLIRMLKKAGAKE